MLKITRISFVVAIAAGLFVCGANTLHLKHKLTGLRVDLQKQTAGRAQAESALQQSEKTVHSLSGDLKALRADLQNLAAERQRALADARALRLLVQVTELEKVNVGIERDKVLQELSRYKTAGLEPEQIVRAAEYISSLETTLTKLHAENKVLQK